MTTPPEETQLDPDAEVEELTTGLDLSEEEMAQTKEMVNRLREQFGLDDDEPEETDEPDDDTEVETEPETPTEPEEPSSPAQPVARDDVVVIDGREVPVAEARSLIDLRNYLAEHPEKAAEVRRVLEDQPAPVAEVAAEPPEWLDRDDPAQVHFWRTQQEQAAQLRSLSQTQAQSAQEQARTRAVNDANAGISTFRTLHPELSEDDITKLRTHAVSLNIIDGLARTRSGSDAIVKALDIAYLDHPEFKARVLGEPSPVEEKKAKAKERKTNLSALSGTSGSAPRTDTPRRPSTDNEMKAAAAKWLSEQGVL